MTRDLAFCDFLLERIADGDVEVQAAFGRHVHWGYWADPTTADGSSGDFADAAEAMSRRVCELAGVRDGTAVMDVGCGLGGTLASLNERFARLRLVGANIDRRQLACAQALVVPQHGNTIHLVQGDGSALPFAGATVDTIVAIQTIHHFRRRSFFADARRLLKRGGRMVVSDFVSPPSLRSLGRVGSRVFGPIVAAGIADADAGWTVDDYREHAAERGLRLDTYEDVTFHTMQTYPVLRRLVRDKSRWPTRAVAAATEWVTGAGIVCYALLGFEAV